MRRVWLRDFADDASDIEVVEIYEGEEEGADSLTPYESCPAYSSSAGSDQSDVSRLRSTTKAEN